MGSPCAYLDIQLEIRPGTKKKVRNKAIPSRAREPAELSIYASLRSFRINLCPVKNLLKLQIFSCLALNMSFLQDCFGGYVSAYNVGGVSKYTKISASVEKSEISNMK